jgi:hypothetical protein
MSGWGVTAVLAAALVRSDLRRAWRPGTSRPGSASAPLWGSGGSTNLDARGHEQPVTADQARAADRRRALRITAASAAVGLGVALVTMSL